MHSGVPLTPVTLLERSANAYPDRPALIYSDGVMSYQLLRERSRRLARALGTLQITHGNSVAIWAENGPPMVEAHFAVPGAGAVLVTLNPWMSETDLVNQVEFCEAKILISEERLYQNLSSVARQRLCQFLRVLLIRQSDSQALEGVLDYEQCLDMAHDSVSLEAAVVSEFDPIAINFTSGTSGRPKGVVYSHRAGYLHSLGQVLMLGLNRKSKYLWTLPMFHVNGWGHMWACIAAGCTQIIPSANFRQEQATEFNELVRLHGITHMAGAPRLAKALKAIHQPFGALSGMTVMTGGSAPAPRLIQELESIGVNLIHQYGLNETVGPFVVCEPQSDWDMLTPEERAQLYARQGIPAIHAGTGVQVLDTLGNPVPHDGRSLGEVTMVGNTLAIGYFKNLKATENSFRGGRFYSGDMAVVHKDGYLEIRDRVNDVIYVETDYGWENVSSIEIENTLSGHPAIQDVAILSVADPDGDNKSPLLVVFVERQPGSDISESEFKALCEAKLSEYKRPQLVFFGTLPKTSTGKTHKHLLREEVKLRLKDTAIASNTKHSTSECLHS